MEVSVPSFGTLTSDNKVLHLKAEVVSNIIAKIEDHFGKMTVTRGDEHEFLGMSIVFNKC